MYFFYIKKHALMLKTDNLVGIFFVIMCAKKDGGFSVHRFTTLPWLTIYSTYNSLSLSYSLSLLNLSPSLSLFLSVYVIFLCLTIYVTINV